MTDQQALHEYAIRQDAEAFRILVEHYQRLVYSAASRRLAQVADIEDVVQLTFLKLAKSAGTIRRDLAGWLYRTTINTANDFIRRDQTRHRHEALISPKEWFVHDTEREDWQKLSQIIDDVLLELPNSQQSLIIEYFLRGRSQRNLAEELNISQPTVLRRINAAVDELRRRLADRGHTMAAPLISAAFEKFPQPSIPSALTSELAKVGLSGLSTGSTAGAWLVNSLLLKVGLGAITLILFLAAGGILLNEQSAPKVPGAAPTSAPSGPTADSANWRRALGNAYTLLPSQNIKFIPPSTFPQRKKYLQEVYGLSGLSFIQWRWIDGALRAEDMGSGGTPLGGLLTSCAKLDWYHIDLVGIPKINADGDWIVRDGVSTEAILADLHTILRQHFKIDLRYEKTELVRDALVATGEYHLHKIPDATLGDLQIFTDVMDHPKLGDSTAGHFITDPPHFWNDLEGILPLPIVDEATNEPAMIDWLYSFSIANSSAASRQQLLDNITKQTGIKFEMKKRTFPILRFTLGSNKTMPATSPSDLKLYLLPL